MAKKSEKKESKVCEVCNGTKLVPREVGSDENKSCPACSLKK